jgi:hypothetical protein
MDLTTTILPFLCGSLAATMIFTVIIWRQGVIDDRMIRHIRSTAYNKGWQDGKDSQYKAE